MSKLSTWSIGPSGPSGQGGTDGKWKGRPTGSQGVKGWAYRVLGGQEVG